MLNFSKKLSLNFEMIFTKSHNGLLVIISAMAVYYRICPMNAHLMLRNNPVQN